MAVCFLFYSFAATVLVSHMNDCNINLPHHCFWLLFKVSDIFWIITHFKLAKYFARSNGLVTWQSNYSVITTFAAVIPIPWLHHLKSGLITVANYLVIDYQATLPWYSSSSQVCLCPRPRNTFNHFYLTHSESEAGQRVPCLGVITVITEDPWLWRAGECRRSPGPPGTSLDGPELRKTCLPPSCFVELFSLFFVFVFPPPTWLRSHIVFLAAETKRRWLLWQLAAGNPPIL